MGDEMTNGNESSHQRLVRRYGNLDQIQVGDEIATEGTVGVCSGGAAYGLTEPVTEVTETEIKTKDGTYSREDGQATSPPFAYEIAWWISQPNAKGTLLESTDLLAVLSEMKEYIKSTEETIDWEWGDCRKFDEIHKAGEVTDTYDRICDILSANAKAEEGER